MRLAMYCLTRRAQFCKCVAHSKAWSTLGFRRGVRHASVVRSMQKDGAATTAAESAVAAAGLFVEVSKKVMSKSKSAAGALSSGLGERSVVVRRQCFPLRPDKRIRWEGSAPAPLKTSTSQLASNSHTHSLTVVTTLCVKGAAKIPPCTTVFCLESSSRVSVRRKEHFSSAPKRRVTVSSDAVAQSWTVARCSALRPRWRRVVSCDARVVFTRNSERRNLSL
mmetsp:Transcript_35396/g.70233  ORF Transcript_35396/g.70233 Transcript_35396/m.70233 type:complete len:222 (-) Transcript_35396:164-829(-)